VTRNAAVNPAAAASRRRGVPRSTYRYSTAAEAAISPKKKAYVGAGYRVTATFIPVATVAAAERTPAPKARRKGRSAARSSVMRAARPAGVWSVRRCRTVRGSRAVSAAINRS
jgi:hypothetical protein